MLGFFLGVRNRRVAATLAAHGFTAEDLAEGWRLMQALTRGRLDVTAIPADADPALLVMLDAWENKWFPIVSASLRTRFPAAHEVIFKNLTQTDGVEVIVSVSTLIERLEGLGPRESGKEARALLEKRGLTKKVIGEAKALLASLGTFDKTVEPDNGPTEEEEAALETALWDWYLEWSRIARAAIQDRRLLQALGFLTYAGGGRGATEPEEDPIDVPEPVVAATPRPGNGSGTPRVEPGMPGSDPFEPAP